MISDFYSANLLVSRNSSTIPLSLKLQVMFQKNVRHHYDSDVNCKIHETHDFSIYSLPFPLSLDYTIYLVHRRISS